MDSPRRADFFIPPEDHWRGAYHWMAERARLAQADGGVIEGTIFRQGETDNGHDVWVGKVHQLASTIEHAAYVTTDDLVGIDAFQVDADGVHILGRRYGEAMASALAARNRTGTRDHLDAGDQAHEERTGTRTVGGRAAARCL